MATVAELKEDLEAVLGRTVKEKHIQKALENLEISADEAEDRRNFAKLQTEVVKLLPSKAQEIMELVTEILETAGFAGFADGLVKKQSAGLDLVTEAGQNELMKRLDRKVLVEPFCTKDQAKKTKYELRKRLGKFVGAEDIYGGIKV
jgi:hypothetical protein